ncbi:MAG: hypothetical protein IKE59_04585 [Erysipelotrichaceae bacterium]|nr:hypothetical protein [Erysipelotrichaceae bacterium]
MNQKNPIITVLYVISFIILGVEIFCMATGRYTSLQGFLSLFTLLIISIVVNALRNKQDRF